MADDGYGKYRKMLKMGIPRLQVDTCMRMDGKDPAKFTEQDPNEAAVGSESAGMDLSLKGDAYDKYRKMLKCGLPMGAALQAMAKDGVDPKGFDVSGGGGGSAASSDSAPVPSTPASTTQEASASPSSSDPGAGGGFLSELKMKAEKKAASPAKTIEAPRSSVTPPKMTPPKLASPAPTAAVSPVQKPTPAPVVLKSTPPLVPIVASPPIELKKEAITTPPRPVSTKVSSTPSPVLKPSPVIASTSPAISAQSDNAMNEIVDQVISEESSPIDSSKSNSPSGGKKWTPPAKSSPGEGDWKSFMAVNKIAVKPKDETEVKEAEMPVPQTDIKRDSPTKVEELSPATAAAVAVAAAAESKRASVQLSKPEPAKAASPVPANKTVTGSPSAKPATGGLASKPTTSSPSSSPAGGKTLKKRHSNDYKAMLAPFQDPSPARSSATANSSPVPPTKSVQATASPSSPAPKTTSTSNNLNKSNEQRLPAWAAVEKPGFLMNGNSTTKITESVPKSIPKDIPEAINKAVVVPQANTAPKVTPVAPAQAQAPVAKPVEAAKPAVVMQPATGSIPKGFQRRFAWEQ